MHAEHLGHFLALQNVPRINAEIERTLFQGLCNLFTRETVLSLYKTALTGEALQGVLSCDVTSKGKKKKEEQEEEDDDEEEDILY